MTNLTTPTHHTPPIRATVPCYALVDACHYEQPIPPPIPATKPQDALRQGETHPLFLTQYALLPLRGGGGYLTPTQIALAPGSHPRSRNPTPPALYIAGIDFAGESEQLEDEILTRPGRDATVITIGELIPPTPPDTNPSIKVVEHYAWVGKKHSDLYPQMLDIIRMWGCTKVSCDATGIGEPLTSF